MEEVRNKNVKKKQIGKCHKDVLSCQLVFPSLHLTELNANGLTLHFKRLILTKGTKHTIQHSFMINILTKRNVWKLPQRYKKHL